MNVLNFVSSILVKMANPGDLHMFRVQTPSFLISSFEIENQPDVSSHDRQCDQIME